MSQKDSPAAKGRVPVPNSTAMRQHLQEAFQRGKQLSAEKGFDYAHELFVQCVLKDPNNVAFVEALLANLRAKFGGDKKKVRFALGLGKARELNKAIAAKDWQNALQLGIERLKADPWHVSTLRSLAEVCATLHHNEVELIYLKQALDAKPRDADVNRHCAHSLGRMGQFDQAIACWHRVEIICPRDQEAARMIGMLAEERLKYPNGRPPTAEQTIETPALASVAEESRSESTAAIPFSPRQRLERAIADDPHDVANYLDLAKLLCEAEQFHEAERILNRGIATVGKHTALVDCLQKVQSQRATQEMLAAEALREAERRRQKKPFRMPWLEAGLGVAALVLTFQFFPSLAATTWQTLDLREWSRTTWFVANAFVLLLLCGIRFGPDLFKSKNQTDTFHRHAGGR